MPPSYFFYFLFFISQCFLLLPMARLFDHLLGENTYLAKQIGETNM